MINEDFNIKSGFKISDTYFEDFKDKMLNISYLENKITDKEYFKIPDNYFEKSKKQILNATIQRPRKIITIVRYAAASVVVALLAGSGWIFLNQNEDKENETMAVLTASEIQNYLENVYFENKTFLVTEQLVNSQLDFSFVKLRQENDFIENDFIEDYLLENGENIDFDY